MSLSLFFVFCFFLIQIHNQKLENYHSRLRIKDNHHERLYNVHKLWLRTQLAESALWIPLVFDSLVGPWSGKIKSLNSLPAIDTHTPHLHCAIPPLAPTVWLLCPLKYEWYVFHGSDLFLTNQVFFPSILPQFKSFGQITNIYSPLLFNPFADFTTSPRTSYFYPLFPHLPALFPLPQDVGISQFPPRHSAASVNLFCQDTIHTNGFKIQPNGSLSPSSFPHDLIVQS